MMVMPMYIIRHYGHSMSGVLQTGISENTSFSSQIHREGFSPNPIRTTGTDTLVVAGNVCPYPPATTDTLVVAGSDGQGNSTQFDTLKSTGQ
jgi:hypothetical protein